MKIKSILITLFVLTTMIMSSVSAELSFETNLEKTDKSYTISILDMAIYAVDIDAADPWNTYATPGEEITVDIVICNWDATGDNYFAQMYIIDSQDNGEFIWATPSNVYIAPDACAPDYFFKFNAPTTPGTYKVEFSSFKASDWSLDDTSYFWLHVEGGTPPPDDPVPDDPVIPNNPPIVNVITTKSGNTFNYDASSSTDIDGSIVTREWRLDGIVMGTDATYSLNTDDLKDGVHIVLFTATDDDGASSTYDHTFEKTVINNVVVIEDETEQYAEQDSPDTATDDQDETAPFVMTIGGQPYYIPGFSAMFAIAGLLAVAYLIYREREE